jgi:A/G-specific adenine glycosylase
MAATTARTMQELVLAWYSQHGRRLPWRKTRDPYAILVSEVMLQQSPVGSAMGVAIPVTMRY